jgi:PAS domain S-box-containing protein
VEPALEPSTEEVTRLRDAVNDLRGTMALPALWTGGEPPRIVSTSLDALLGLADELEERAAQRRRELAMANEALRESERNSRLVVDSIPGFIAAFTPTGELEFVNRPVLDYFGKTLEDLKHWGTGGMTHPEDHSHVVELFTRAIATGDPFEVELRARRSDGVYRWFQSRGRPLRDTNGHIVRWYNLLIDIDERKHAEEALRESERKFRLLVETIPALVWRGTSEGELDYLNERAVEYLGHTAQSLTGGRWIELVHPDHREATVRRWLHSATTGSSYDDIYKIRRADGQYRWIQSVGEPFRDQDGRIAHWYGTIVDIDERKRAEEALAASERDLKIIIDTIPALAWSARSDGNAEFFNQHYLDFTGLSAEQAGGWGWTAAVHPDDLEGLAATWQRIMASEAQGEAEARLRRHDGEYRWFLFRASPLHDEKGFIVKWYGVNTDIEDRRRAEQELRRSEARKAAILDSALDCIVTIDHQGCITEFNPAAERTFGYRRDELVGQPLADVIVPPALRERHRQGFARYLATGETRVLGRRIEMTAVRSDGSAFPTELAITRIPLDGPPSFTGYLRDITERKRAEEELRRSEAFLAEAQQLSRVGSFSWRVSTDEIMCSEQWYRIFEIDRDVRVSFEVIGTRVHPEDLSAFKEQVERSRRDGSDVQLEIRLQMPDGTVKHIHVVAHCREDSGQREYIGAVQDVTQRRLSEEALAKVRSELAHVARVTSLGVLTASIAHEVNQPLAGIITNASTCLRMLGADPPDVDGARETARRTIRDGNRASDVMTRLRALFSKKEFSLESLDLNEATREVLALSLSDLQRHRVILQSELADDLPIITGDRIQLQQVILNLLRNASDAMVAVHERPRLLRIKTEREDGNRVRLSVRDAGMGLPPQSLDSLFDAFYTTTSGGMGIGLFVSRAIVERHQGRLWAEPNDGPGATFSFSLPFQTT